MREDIGACPSNGVGKMVVFCFVLSCFTSTSQQRGWPSQYSVTSHETGALFFLIWLGRFNGDATLKVFFCQNGDGKGSAVLIHLQPEGKDALVFCTVLCISRHRMACF